MAVLVTGGTGFLGTALVSRLAELGTQVRVLARPTSDLSGLPPGVEVRAGDVTDYDSLARAAEGATCIVHLAALVQAWAKDPDLFRQVNVGGTQNVLQVMRESPSVTRLLYTSTFFALGPTDGTVQDGSRDHPGVGFCTLYERTKYEADCLALRAAREEGLHVLMVYPGVIYGPGRVSTANLVVKLVVDHMHGRLPGLVGPGTRLNCFVHVNDVVAGMLSALECGRPGVRYVLGGENASMLALFNLVRSITGRPPPRLHIPIWVAKLLGLVATAVARLGGPVPIFTYQSVEAFRHDWAYSSAVAQADLGYSPLPLHQGLQETLLWLRGHRIISF